MNSGNLFEDYHLRKGLENTEPKTPEAKARRAEDWYNSNATGRQRARAFIKYARMVSARQSFLEKAPGIGPEFQRPESNNSQLPNSDTTQGKDSRDYKE